MNINRNLILLYVVIYFGLRGLARPFTGTNHKHQNLDQFQEKNINLNNVQIDGQITPSVAEMDNSLVINNEQYETPAIEMNEHYNPKSKKKRRPVNRIKYEDSNVEYVMENINPDDAEDVEILSGSNSDKKQDVWPLNAFANKSVQLNEMLLGNISNCYNYSNGHLAGANFPINLFLGDNISVINYILLAPETKQNEYGPEGELCETTIPAENLEPLSAVESTTNMIESSTNIIETTNSIVEPPTNMTESNAVDTLSSSALDISLSTTSSDQHEEQTENINNVTAVTGSLPTDSEVTQSNVSELVLTGAESTTVSLVSTADNITSNSTASADVTISSSGPVEVETITSLTMVTVSECPSSTCESDFVDNSLKPITFPPVKPTICMTLQFESNTTEIINTTIFEKSVDLSVSNSVIPTTTSTISSTAAGMVSIGEPKLDKVNRIKIAEMLGKSVKNFKNMKHFSTKTKAKKARHGDYFKFRKRHEEEE